MGTAVADLFVVLDSVTDPFSRGLSKAAADAESESKRMSGALGLVAKVGLGLGVAVVGIGVASIKAATDFQTNMTRLVTAAGASKQAVAGATSEVLALGTQVGMTGTQMAEALYHPISAGLDMATSLQVVKYAAEEAQISGANLDDTTYSLSSVMKAFNYPASQAAQTMADLNAVVGQGDTHFQDFNASIKNWAPTAAQMGLSVKSMGAGLDYLMDRGNGAEEAATRLTMGLSMMTTPTKAAAKLLEGMGVASSDVTASTSAMTEVLKKTGITQNQLAADLAKPDGIYVALNHLKTALDAAGVHGTEADSVLAKLFGGGRSDKAVLSLMQNLDGLKTKYDQIVTAANPQTFASEWATTKSTFAFQITQMKAAVENFGIELGMKALPALSAFIATSEKDLGSFFGQVSSGFTGTDLKMPNVPNLGHAGLNQIASHLQEPQTAFQRFGQTVHAVLGDVETFGKRLLPIGQNFVTFGVDVWQAGLKIVSAVTPTVELIGKGLFGAIELAGKAAANILGPAIKGFADFLAAHQGAVKFFSEVILGGLIVKMTVLGALRAAQGIVGLATAIVSFPLGQASQIGDAFTALKTAFAGKEAAEGEQAVQGLAGAFSNLKQAGSNVLDKILPDSGKLANLAQMGTGIKGIEAAAESGGEQLSLFETNMQGIVQAADHEQLSLFDTEVTNLGTDAGTAAGGMEKAATSAEGLGSKIGKFALAGGVVGGAVFGLVTLGQTLGQMAGVGDHTAMSMDKVNSMFSLITSGSTQASAELTKTAGTMVYIADVSGGKASQGLQQVDQGLAQMVTSGHATQAQAQFQAIAQELTKQGLSAKDAASKFPTYEQAVKDAGDAAQTMDGQVQGLTGTLSKEQSVTQFNSDLLNLTQAIQTNGRALTGNTQQAIANQQAFQQAASDVLQYYQQQRNANVPINQATADMQKQIAQLEQTGISAGLTKGQVDSYLQTLGLIKPGYSTTITANTSPALNSLNNLLYQINSSSGTISVYENSSGTVGSTQTKVTARASGGPVQRNNTYWVGEHGPELVTFGANGYVTPAEMLKPAALAGSRASGGGAGGTTIVYQTNVAVAGNVLTEKQLVDVIRTQVLQWNLRNSSNGWALSSSK